MSQPVLQVLRNGESVNHGYNPFNAKRGNSSGLGKPMNMAQVEAAVNYIKNQNYDVNKVSLPSFSGQHSSFGPSRQLQPPPKQLFSLGSSAATAIVPTIDPVSIQRPQSNGPPRAMSSQKSVRFAKQLEITQSGNHQPQDANALPLVSVLKTSGRIEIDSNSVQKSMVSSASISIERKETTAPSAFQVSGELPQSKPIKSTGAVVTVLRKNFRPSLSDQLAAIGANAAALTQDIRLKAGLDAARGTEPALQTYPARCFTVGTLNCRYPSPVTFFQDRMEYTFHHPYENSEIRMVMYYRDMIGASIASNKLRYKLPRALTHFPVDFDPSNPQHLVTVEFTSSSAASTVKQKILPLITPSLSFGNR